MLGIALLLLVIGTGALLVGMRGRFVGDDLHCRRCGFNLRGRDQSSTRCSECGTDLTRATVTIGRRQRWPALAATGVVALVLAAAGLGISGWRWATTTDWSSWKKTAWLLEDCETGGALERQRACDELRRRVHRRDFAQQQVDHIVDHTLKLQADRTKPWNSELGQLVEEAAQLKRVDAPRWQRYLQQAVSASIQMKPKIRRNKDIGIAVKGRVDRCYSRAASGVWHIEPLHIGDDATQRFRPDEPSKFAGGFGNTHYIPGHLWSKLSIGDGKQEVRTKVIVECELPGIEGSAKVELPVSTVVEVVAEDAIIDTFEAQPSQRQKVAQAFEQVLVKSHSLGGGTSYLRLRMRLHGLPTRVAADAVIVQGQTEHKLGSILLQPDGYTRWTWLSAFVKAEVDGDVEVHLRPSQDPADHLPVVETYWGEPIIFRNVRVNALYAAPFNQDESLRPAVEKSISVHLQRKGVPPNDFVEVNWRANKPPIDLAYSVVLRQGDWQRVLEATWKADHGGDDSDRHSVDLSDLPDPHGTCDIIFTPSDEWEDQLPSPQHPRPWGGRIVMRDLKVPPQEGQR